MLGSLNAPFQGFGRILFYTMSIFIETYKIVHGFWYTVLSRFDVPFHSFFIILPNTFSTFVAYMFYLPILAQAA